MIAASLQRNLWLGAIACVTVGLLPAADAPRGRPIEFSAPRNERGETNKPTLLPGRASLLDQMEADLNRPFKSLQGDSLGGMMLTAPQPLPPPVLQSPRAKTLIDRKRDPFLTAEEMFPIPGLEDLSKKYELTPDGRRKSDLSGMELRLSEALNRPGPRGPTNQAGSFLTPAYGNSDPGAFPGLNGSGQPFGTAPGKGLNRLFGESSSAKRARESMDNKELFGLGQPSKFGSKLTQSELQRRDSLMQIFNPNYVAPVEGAAPAPGNFSTPYVDSSFYDPPKPVVPSPTFLHSPASSSASSAGATYVPSYVPPAPAPVKPTPPPAPSSPFMNVPRRNF